MIENINELAKFVKGGADVLQKAIDNKDNVSLEFVEGSFVSDEELETTKTKRFNDGKKEGQTIGYDFAMKDVKSDFGLEVEGKDRKVIVEAARKKLISDAGIKPNEKISELETSLSNLQGTYNTDKATWEQETNSYKGRLKDITIMSELQRNTPEVNGLKANQFATLAKTEFDFDFDDNNVLYAKKNGQPVKDKMEKLIPVKDILTDYATQNGWFGSSGRGGGNEGGKGNSEFKTINDVYRNMETNNIDPMSPQGEKMLNDFNKD